ncbi:MAG: response regulator [Hyellaceae cyanobacterium CSU_1_1]|nr:response regulator [Hyellaceae cyanobacterium CSU_1_1]
MRQLMQAILDFYGFKSITAENGAIGLQLAKEHIPDLIICDLAMPELDGYGVLKAVREDAKTSNIPCITVAPELGVEYVARLFANSRLRRAPVVKDTLLGIISVSDLLNKSDFVEKPKSNFELYCEENPSAPEARIYED